MLILYGRVLWINWGSIEWSQSICTIWLRKYEYLTIAIIVIITIVIIIVLIKINTIGIKSYNYNTYN
jgi:hypothetical protein